MDGVESPEAGRVVKGSVFVGFLEKKVAPTGVFVTGDEAED